jgi:hypothetical protein
LFEISLGEPGWKVSLSDGFTGFTASIWNWWDSRRRLWAEHLEKNIWILVQELNISVSIKNYSEMVRKNHRPVCQWIFFANQTFFFKSVVVEEGSGKVREFGRTFQLFPSWTVYSSTPYLAESHIEEKVYRPTDGEFFKNDSKWQLRDEKWHWDSGLSSIGSDLRMTEDDCLNWRLGIASRYYLNGKWFSYDISVSKALNHNWVSLQVSHALWYTSDSPLSSQTQLCEPMIVSSSDAQQPRVSCFVAFCSVWLASISLTQEIHSPTNSKRFPQKVLNIDLLSLE